MRILVHHTHTVDLLYNLAAMWRSAFSVFGITIYLSLVTESINF